MFVFGLEGFDVGKVHLLNVGYHLGAPCNLLGGFLKFLRPPAIAHPANAPGDLEVYRHPVVFPSGVVVVGFLKQFNADVAFAGLFARPGRPHVPHFESVLVALALDNLGDFLFGHFVFLLFGRLCFPFRYVYIRSLWRKQQVIIRIYLCIQSPKKLSIHGCHTRFPQHHFRNE